MALRRRHLRDQRVPAHDEVSSLLGQQDVPRAPVDGYDEADFVFPARQTGLTAGNISSHMARLEEVGDVRIDETFVGKRLRTATSSPMLDVPHSSATAST